MSQRRILTIISLILLLLSISEYSEAILKPQEILVVVNAESEDSLRLGKVYTELRGIPPSHIAEIRVAPKDDVSRRDYDELIATPIREDISRIEEKGKKLRCIVTVYGVPLRISAQRPPGTLQEEVEKYEALLKQKRDKLAEMKKGPGWWNKYFKEEAKKADIENLQNEIGKIKFEYDHLMGHDTIAAVDSELALLLSSPYDLPGWQMNPEALFIKGKINNTGRILMVSRLDAPEPGLVEKMIRTAMEVEKTGLSGKMYLDARGLKSNNPYARFDEDIRRTAEVLKKSSVKIILDNRPELFGAGEAADAALYCGWYSLGEYKDAFGWAKGAVGYHVASSEARSLHDPKGHYWVKSMLERGVIASLGPVTEPYLTAFPPPSVFFPLLLSGQYSLAEVFAMSNPFLSWQMILVGDPLYNPFKGHPAYKLQDPPPPPG